MREKDGQPRKAAYEISLRESAEMQAVQTQTQEPPPTEPQSAHTAAADELLHVIPAESLFAVRANNFEYNLAQADQFLAGVSPLPMGLSMMARAQLAKILGSPQLNGVNMSGSFALFATAKPTGSAEPQTMPQLFVAALVPVTDYTQFITGNPNIAEPDQKGVSQIKSEAAPPLLAAGIGAFALITSANNYQMLAKMAGSPALNTQKSLQAALQPEQIQQARSQPFWAHVNIQQVQKDFGPLLLGGLEAAKMQMKTMQQQGAMPAASLNMAERVMDIYAQFAQTIMQQTKSVDLTASPDPDVFKLTATVIPLSATDMAEMFTRARLDPSENKLLAYLQDGAFVNFAGNINAPLWKKINAAGIDLMARFADEDFAPEDAAAIKAIAEKIIDALGGAFAESFIIQPQSKPPFAFTYILEAKDPTKLNTLIEQYLARWNTAGLADFYSSFGINTSFTVTPEPESYHDIRIHTARFAVKPIDTNTPEAQIIDMMYGGGIDYKWATLDNLCVAAGAGDADRTIRNLIDEVKAAAPPQMAGEIKAAVQLVPDAAKADFMVTLNLLRAFKMITAFSPIPLPQMELQTQSNIILTGKAQNQKLVIDAALPKQHLVEIMAAFQMIMQQKMMPQTRQSPTKPAPHAAIAPDVHIASQVVQGQITGTEVTLENAELEGNVLALYTGDSWGLNPSVLIFIFDIEDGTIPDSKTFLLEPDSPANAPTIHVHYRWKDPESGEIKAEIETQKISLNLKFNEHAEGKIPGSLLLEIPGKQTRLEGNFNAVIKTTPQADSEKRPAQPTSNVLGHHLPSGFGSDLEQFQFQNRYGPARTVKLKIIGVKEDTTAEAVAEKLKAITGSKKNSLSYRVHNDTMIAQLAPVKDVHALARKIRFGTVIAIDTRNITIRINKTGA